MLEKKIENIEDIENPEQILLGIRKDYTMVNTSASPDEMFSYATMMMHHTIKLILKYEETLPDLPREKRMTTGKMIEAMTSIIHTYNLVDAGMTADEAQAITKMEGTVHEIRKKETKN